MSLPAQPQLVARTPTRWLVGHPGLESAYILEGEGVFLVKGQPDRHFKAMDNWQVQPEVPHSLRNGDKKTKIAITYVVEKDKPLASPAPE